MQLLILCIPKFQRCNVKVWEWISHSSRTLLGHTITSPCWYQSEYMLDKGAPFPTLGRGKWPKKRKKKQQASRELHGFTHSSVIGKHENIQAYPHETPYIVLLALTWYNIHFLAARLFWTRSSFLCWCIDFSTWSELWLFSSNIYRTTSS